MKKVLIISASVHLALLVLLPLLPNLGIRQPLAMEVYAVELVDIPRPAPPVETVEQEPEPAPEPEVEQPKVEQPPEEKPIPEEPAKLPARTVTPPPPKREEKSLEEKIAERLKAEERERPKEEPRKSTPPPPSGTTKITAGQVADYYLTMLQGKITRNWKQPSARFSGGSAVTARVSFTVLRDGQVTDLRLARSSGWSTVDQSAVQAVRSSAPFGELPSTYVGNRLDVTIDFTVTQ